ncbi:cytohesin-interacting protein-like [Myxocyprinus asiaticus]|uniref:cytohesin-interacting protein-like n=1 Tax=Myxocyprinus asiaticus TaxID=70543 RepID=UPI002221D54A|nr:cytohesin-interacting protein-like [Myxocyprinus asiaticus]
MTASVQYIRKLLGKGSCATNNLFNTGHKTQKSTNDHKATKNKDESHTRNIQQPRDNREHCIWKSVILRRKENETFGFDIQTSSDEGTVSSEQDLGACVCWVKENSIAESCGLIKGDAIVTVNSVHTAGFTCQQIKDLIQKSCLLKMEFIRGATVKHRQLFGKLYLLQRQLTEKHEELQTLITQEVRLQGGATEGIQKPPNILQDPLIPSADGTD